MAKVVCTNCGAVLQEGTKFCAKCGTPVLDAAISGATRNSYENKRKALFVLISVLVSLFLIIWGAIALSDYSEKRINKLAYEKYVKDSLEAVKHATTDNNVDAVSEATILEDAVEYRGTGSHNFGDGIKIHHHLVGSFTDTEGIWPVELDFNNSGLDVSDVIYKNVTYGGKIRMLCTEFDYNHMRFEGKDGNSAFILDLRDEGNRMFGGTASVGSKILEVNMEAMCSHND